MKEPKQKPIAMKRSIFKFLAAFLIAGMSHSALFAQDDDGIYSDIYQSPQVDQDVASDTGSSPLDGYSTVDDYYPEGGYDPADDRPYDSEQYVDGNGNTIINNYYGDYYDYEYSSRIRRFHRNDWYGGYYDPWYTNMYYYTYDPFYWGTSIYVGYAPSYNWYVANNLGWTWGWGFRFGFGTPYYSSACFGWGNPYYCGWGNPFWNGYNYGYWNGYYDALAFNGYFNTYDPYSGIYYGPRGGGNSVGSGYRGRTFAEVYNKAAKEGKVHHANRFNELALKDPGPVKGTIDDRKPQLGKDVSRPASDTRNTVNAGKDRPSVTSSGSERTAVGNVKDQNVKDRSTGTADNPYTRPSKDRGVVESRPRSVPSSMDRNRDRVTTTVRPNVSTDRNVYQRGDQTTRRYTGSQDRYRGNVRSQSPQVRPSTDYQRNNNGSGRYSLPSQSGNDRYSRPQQQVPTRNYTPPVRSTPSKELTPSRNPSRNVTPEKNSRPSGSVTPRTGSNRSVTPKSVPSRGSYSVPSSGKSYSSPSRNAGSGSRSGRP